jgi:hypothetical protein
VTGPGSTTSLTAGVAVSRTTSDQNPRIALRVEVGAVPQAGLLRAAIAARLTGRPFPSGPEDAVAHAVADAVRGAAR